MLDDGVRRSEFEAWAGDLDQRGLEFIPHDDAHDMPEDDPVGKVTFWLDPSDVHEFTTSEISRQVLGQVEKIGGCC